MLEVRAQLLGGMPSKRTRRVRLRQQTVKPSSTHAKGRNKACGQPHITVDDGARWARDMRAGVARTQQERELLASDDVEMLPSSTALASPSSPRSIPASDKLRSMLRSMQLLDGVATPLLPPGCTSVTCFDRSLMGSELPESVVRAMRAKRLCPLRSIAQSAKTPSTPRAQEATRSS